MENAQESIVLEVLRQELKTAEQERNTADERVKALRLVVAGFQPETPQPQQLTLPSFLPVSQPKLKLDYDLSGIEIDFSPASNLLERVFLVFEAVRVNDKLVNIGEVGRYLIEKGQTRATLKNIKTTVSHIISDYSEHFALIEKGTYKYVPVVNEELMTIATGNDGFQ